MSVFEQNWLVPTAIGTIVIDGLIKAEAVRRFSVQESIGTYLSIGLHQNPGIAFDIPFKMPLIFVLSAMIGIVLFKIVIRNWTHHRNISISALLIIIGALGNLCDRIVYGYTVDYLFILKRLAINLSDLVILFGIVGLLLAGRRS